MSDKERLTLELMSVCMTGNLEEVKRLTTSEETKHLIDIKNEWLLINAASNNHLEVIKFLLTSPELEDHADINSDDDSCLINACINGHLELVKFLLTDEILTVKPKNLSRALVESIKGKKMEVIEYLIMKYGVKKDSQIERKIYIYQDKVVEKMFMAKELSESLNCNTMAKNKLKV